MDCQKGTHPLPACVGGPCPRPPGPRPALELPELRVCEYWLRPGFAPSDVSNRPDIGLSPMPSPVELLSLSIACLIASKRDRRCDYDRERWQAM